MIDAFVSNPYAALGAVLLASFVGFVGWRNNRATRVAAASATFRTAFADALLRLRASSEATYTIVFQNHDGHLLAINAFLPYVAWYRRRSFECAAKEYSMQANTQRAKGPLEALVFDFEPEAQAQRAALLAAVEKLFSHASAT